MLYNDEDNQGCCKNDCLPRKFNRDEVKKIVESCLREVVGSQCQKKNIITDKLRTIITKVHSSGRYSYEWSLGSPPNAITGICARTFQICYDVGHTSLTEMAKSVINEWYNFFIF